MIFSAGRHLFRLRAVAAVAFVFLAATIYGELMSFAEVASPDIRPRLKGSIEAFNEDKFESPSAIFIDKEHGEIYLADSIRGEVFVFGLDGSPIFRFGKKQGIDNPTDILVRDDNIYLVQESRPYVEIFNLRGKSIGRIAPGEGYGKDFLPGGMDMDASGNFYVVNKSFGECLIFDSEGVYIGRFGEEVDSITSVVVGKDKVYLLTPFFVGRVVHVYTLSGEYSHSFQAVEGRGGTLALPAGGRVDVEGRFWLVDALRGVVIFSKDSVELSRVGTRGKNLGSLNFPVDIDFDGEGVIYIVEKAGKRISIFK